MSRPKLRRISHLALTLILIFSMTPATALADTASMLTGTSSLEASNTAVKTVPSTDLSKDAGDSAKDAATSETSSSSEEQKAATNDTQTSDAAESAATNAVTEAPAIAELPSKIKQLDRLAAPAVGETFDDGTFKYYVTSETTVLVGDGQSGSGLVTTSSSLGDIAIPSTVTYGGQTFTVTEIGVGAFKGCTVSINSLEIPGTVETIGADAFREIRTIKTYKLNEGLKSIGQAAWQDSSFDELIVPSTCTSLAKNAFRERVTPLTSTVIFKGKLLSTDTSVYQGRNVKFTVRFLDTNGTLVKSLQVAKDATLAAEDIPAVPASAGANGTWIPEEGFSLTAPVTNSFVVAPTLPSTTAGQTFEVGPLTFQIRADGSSVQVGTSSALSGLSSNPQLETITDLEIPASVTNDEGLTFPVTTISAQAFKGLTASLNSITIPSSVTVIEREAFRDIPNVKEFILSNGLTTIEQAAFQNTAFTNLVIPQSVTTLEKNAFRDQIGIGDDTVTFSGVAPENVNTDSSIVQGRTVRFTVTFGSTRLTVERNKAITPPAAPLQSGYPGTWLAPSGFSFEAVTNSFTATVAYLLNLKDLKAALDQASALNEQEFASGDWAAIKTAESRAQAFYTMFNTRIENGETLGFDGVDGKGGTVVYQQIVDDATTALNTAIDNAGGRFAAAQQYFIATSDASSYNADKEAVAPLEQSTIFTAQLDRLTSVSEVADKTFSRWPNLHYKVYAAAESTWYKLENGTYVKRTDTQDYPIKGSGDAYQVKVVTNNISNSMLPFSWAKAGEKVAWGTLLDVKTVNDNWVVYTTTIEGKTVYRYLPVDVILPTDANASTVPTSTADPNIWDPTSPAVDPGDPTVPGHSTYTPAGGGGGVSIPDVAGAYPVNGATGVSIYDSFYLAFKNNVSQTGSAANNKTLITLQKADGTLVPALVYASQDRELRRYFFIRPLGPLEYGTNYKIVVAPGIQANNGVKTTNYNIISFSTETNPYVADAGTESVGSPSGSPMSFGARAEAYQPDSSVDQPGSNTNTGGSTGSATNGGSNGSTSGATGSKTSSSAQANSGSTSNSESSTAGDESTAAESDETKDSAATSEENDVALNNDQKSETDAETEAIPLSDSNGSNDEGEASGNRAPIAPGVIAGVIAALAIIAVVAARRFIIAKRRRDNDEA